MSSDQNVVVESCGAFSEGIRIQQCSKHVVLGTEHNCFGEPPEHIQSISFFLDFDKVSHLTCKLQRAMSSNVFSLAPCLLSLNPQSFPTFLTFWLRYFLQSKGEE